MGKDLELYVRLNLPKDAIPSVLGKLVMYVFYLLFFFPSFFLSLLTHDNNLFYVHQIR